MEIAPGVHSVPLPGANGFLVCEDRLTLIDAGLPGSRPVLEGYVSGIGRSLSDLGRIICTHGHPDHVGGVRELETDGVEVLMHPADFEALHVTLGEALRRPSKGRLFAYMARTPDRAMPVHDGDVLPVLGGLEVIHTPGHTPGSICLYAGRDRLLFVGDMFEVRRGRVTFASPVFSDDVRRARASVQRLAERDVDVIIFGHRPPWRDRANDVLQGLADRARREAAG